MIGIASTSSSVETTVSIKRFAIITAIVSNDDRFLCRHSSARTRRSDAFRWLLRMRHQWSSQLHFLLLLQLKQTKNYYMNFRLHIVQGTHFSQSISKGNSANQFYTNFSFYHTQPKVFKNDFILPYSSGLLYVRHRIHCAQFE